MKTAVKIILIVILVVSIIIGSLFIWDLFGFRASTKSKYYEEVAATDDYLPTIDSLPEHKSVKYKYYQNSMLAFVSYSYTMIVEYDEAIYNSQKDIAHLPFENIDKWTTYDGQENHITTNIDLIELDGFSFKMFSEYYPKEIYFIGTNDETNQVAYIYFEDTDLDVIDMPYSTFIRTYCGW